MKKLAALTTVLVVSIPGAALAYVGPGAGLSLLGALWALVVAIVLAVGFVVAWPLRKLLRQKHAARAAGGSGREPHGDSGSSGGRAKKR